MESASEFYIKGMVCDRCVSVLRDGLTAMGFNVEKISLGKVTLESPVDRDSLKKIENFLIENGFEFVNDKHTRLINQVKEIVNEVFSQNVKYDSKLKFSSLLSF